MTIKNEKLEIRNCKKCPFKMIYFLIPYFLPDSSDGLI